MPLDANLVLRGPYGGAYVDLDENDVAPTSLTVNADGNVCVDLGDLGSGALGLDCLVVMHDQPTTYQDTCQIVVCESDHLLSGWATILTFELMYAYLREVIVTATTAFLATDIGCVFTATIGTDTGVLRQFSRNLLVAGGIGKCWVEMQDAGDTYATLGDVVTCTAGQGVGIITKIGRAIQPPRTLVRRFSTMKRYIRCTNTVTAGGNFGDVDILVTGSQHSHVNNLYR